MKLTKLTTIGMVAVLLTAGVVATGAVVPGEIAQQDGPDTDDETETEEDEAEDDEAEDDDAEAGELVVDSLNAPESAAPNENVSVVAEISNDGGEETTEQVEFRLGGAVVDRQFVTLEGDESTTVNFTADTAGAAGDVRHGVFTDADGQIATLTVSQSFVLESVDAPASVETGENVTVNATVANNNDFNTTQPVTFRLEGETVTRENVTIESGETETVEFSLSTEGVEPGTYVHSVFTRDSGEFLELNVTEPGPEEADVVFDDQESDGTTVTVQNLTLPSDGYVAIHNDSLLDGDAVGSVIGVSEYLESGQYDNVTVELFTVPGVTFNESELTENQTLIAMPHNETTGDETYDFVSSNGTDDPPFLADGEPVTDDAAITVPTDEPATDNETETPADDEADTPVDDETETPTETETPADGETPTETETPADDETPTETETPAETDTPADGETPTIVGPAGDVTEEPDNATDTPADNETETPA